MGHTSRRCVDLYNMFNLQLECSRRSAAGNDTVGLLRVWAAWQPAVYDCRLRQRLSKTHFGLPSLCQDALHTNRTHMCVAHSAPATGMCVSPH